MGIKTNPRKPAREGKKIVVGAVDAVPPGRSATIELADGAEVALFNVEGKLYAVENFCPHKAAPLAGSEVYNHKIECQWHGWEFDIRTGECFEKKDCSIEVYEVVIEDDKIKVII